MKSVRNIKPAVLFLLILLCAAGLILCLLSAVRTVRANADARIVEEWRSGAAPASSDADAAAQKIICLTFDDGPSYLTPRILEILKKYGVRATFFVTGSDPDYAYCISEERAAGHTVGLHTYSHDYAEVYASEEAYYQDLEKISRLCVRQLGYIPRYIRFPGGSSNTASARYSPGLMTHLTEDVTERGYIYVDWNCSSGDGEGSLTADELLENARNNGGQNPVILLCHDGGGKETTAEALPSIIEYYLSEGYRFQTVDEVDETAHHRVVN